MQCSARSMALVNLLPVAIRGLHDSHSLHTCPLELPALLIALITVCRAGLDHWPTPTFDRSSLVRDRLQICHSERSHLARKKPRNVVIPRRGGQGPSVVLASPYLELFTTPGTLNPSYLSTSPFIWLCPFFTLLQPSRNGRRKGHRR
jgi:hypothetical protein